MGLNLYSKPHPDEKLSSLSPFTVTFDGRLGGSQAKKLYIRNDDATRWYEDITVLAVDAESPSIVDGSSEGYSWKLLEKDLSPSPQEWDQVGNGETLTITSDLGTASLADTVAYLPLWVRVTTPRNQPISTITSVTLRIAAIEGVVG
jgi:hypothetical protein